MGFTEAARTLGLGPLAPECSSAAVLALALPQDRALVEWYLRRQWKYTARRDADEFRVAAIAMFANHLAAGRKSLRAGQIVLTGSLVQTVWLNAGDKVVMEMSGLGSVAAEFRD